MVRVFGKIPNRSFALSTQDRALNADSMSLSTSANLQGSFMMTSDTAPFGIEANDKGYAYRRFASRPPLDSESDSETNIPEISSVDIGAQTYLAGLGSGDDSAEGGSLDGPGGSNFGGTFDSGGIPPNTSDSIGRILLDARRLFIEHGKGEARVSLREVNRIREYVEAFASTQGLSRAVLNSLWLTLGAGLTRTDLENGLGAELQDLIGGVEISGVASDLIATELANIIQPKSEEMDLSISADEAARIASTDGMDLDANVSVLAKVLFANDERIRRDIELAVDRNYDHTLVTAHRLVNNVSQALTINRFALLSGPPASGKSEVGRYLSARLNWDAEIFNCNRYTSEEDMMQRLGVIANGRTRFTISDGPLARALMDGKLFILNEINLSKPGSLAFLFKVLADVDTEFDYYDAATGKTERRKIHPNFRMIATQNPDGPGRKDLNAALRNRAIEINADSYGALELSALLRSRHPELEKRHPGIAASVVELYEDIAKRIEARTMGDHAEGYVWNLRHLMRLADGFAGHVGDLAPLDIVRIVYQAVGVGLRPEDREQLYDAMQNYSYGNRRVTGNDVSSFEHGQQSMAFAEIFEEIEGIDAEEAANIMDEDSLRDIPTSARFVGAIVSSLRAGYHPWMKGPAGTGKTKLGRTAVKLLGGRLFDDTLTPQTDESRLKGELKPVTKDNRLGFKHVPAPLVNALRASHATEDLVVCMLDEGGFARPDVLEELNSLLDRDGGIWVVSESGDRMEFLRRGKGFRLMVASNTYGYQGVQLQSEAFRSRMHEIYMDFEYRGEELSQLFESSLISQDLGRSLGDVVSKARDLFIEQGKGDARVSLREVNRIREYVEAFASTQGLSRAVLNALWLTLGAGLAKEEVEGEFGRELKKLIVDVQIPEAVNIDAELAQVIEPKPTEFDPSVDVRVSILRKAMAGSFVADLAYSARARIVLPIMPSFGCELLFPIEDGSWRNVQDFKELLGGMVKDEGTVRMVLDHLIELSSNPDDEISAVAVKSLVDLGRGVKDEEIARTIFDRLIELSRDSRKGVRLAAVGGLGLLSKALKDERMVYAIMNRLVELIQDPEESVRRAIAESFGHLSQVVEDDEILRTILENLIGLSKDGYPSEYLLNTVAKSLGLLGQVAKNEGTVRTILDRLTELSKSGYSLTRAGTADGLASLVLAVEDEGMRRTIIDRLHLLSDDRAEPVHKIAFKRSVDLLQSAKDEGARRAILNYLIEVPGDVLKNVPESLVEMIRMVEDEGTIHAILERLMELSRNVDRSEGWGFHDTAVVGLGVIGQMTEDENVRRVIFDHLVEISQNITIDGFLYLSEGMKDVKMAHTLAGMFVEAMNTIEVNRPEKAARGLQYLVQSVGDEGVSRAIMDRFIEFSNSDDNTKRAAAAKGLGHLGQVVEDEGMRRTIFDCLMGLSENPPWIVRLGVADGLGHLGHAVKDEAMTGMIVDRLIELSQDQNESSRKATAKSLGLLGQVVKDEVIVRKVADRLTELSNRSSSVSYQASGYFREAIEKSSIMRAMLLEDLSPFVDRYYTFMAYMSDSADQSVRILSAEGDGTSLKANVIGLAGALSANDERIRKGVELTVDRNYDHTLVTAHRLVNNVSQALTINRFALLSGPPASGKSEVGRYLSSQLGWDTVIFNCNRYTSEEDMMQRVGVKANGKTEFTITDGALAAALIQGKLFILNEINLAKPGSLAFLFKVLADVDTEFDYYDAGSGKTVRRKIHPNFRMIATQNPDGPGRKDLNAALKNRAIEIHAPAYSSLELAALLRTKHPGLEKKHPGVADNVVGLYDDIAKRIEARTMGDHAEGYVWNLRHLMRLAEAFDRHVGSNRTVTAQDVLRIAYNSVGVSLRPKDRESFFDALRTYKYGGVKISKADVAAFRKQQVEMTLGEVDNLIDIPTSARFLDAIKWSLESGHNPWLKGPAGTGKTRLVRAAATALGAQLYGDTLTPQTDDAKLKGDLKPVTKDSKLGFTHVPAPLVNALRASQKTDEMVICFLDEGAFARPDVLEELNSVLDRDGGIWVLKANGDGMEFLRRGKNFRLAVASNTYGYSGVHLQSEAFRSRMHEIFMDFEYMPVELARLFASQHIPDDLARSLGVLLANVREIFIEHGKGDARVSLREVKRIKDYVETFAPTQGLERATVGALWLTLGASLDGKVQDDSDIADNITELISQLKVEGRSSSSITSTLEDLRTVKPSIQEDGSVTAIESMIDYAFDNSILQGMDVSLIAHTLTHVMPKELVLSMAQDQLLEEGKAARAASIIGKLAPHVGDDADQLEAARLVLEGLLGDASHEANVHVAAAEALCNLSSYLPPDRRAPAFAKGVDFLKAATENLGDASDFRKSGVQASLALARISVDRPIDERADLIRVAVAPHLKPDGVMMPLSVTVLVRIAALIRPEDRLGILASAFSGCKKLSESDVSWSRQVAAMALGDIGYQLKLLGRQDGFGAAINGLRMLRGGNDDFVRCEAQDSMIYLGVETAQAHEEDYEVAVEEVEDDLLKKPAYSPNDMDDDSYPGLVVPDPSRGGAFARVKSILQRFMPGDQMHGARSSLVRPSTISTNAIRRVVKRTMRKRQMTEFERENILELIEQVWNPTKYVSGDVQQLVEFRRGAMREIAKRSSLIVTDTKARNSVFKLLSDLSDVDQDLGYCRSAVRLLGDMSLCLLSDEHEFARAIEIMRTYLDRRRYRIHPTAESVMTRLDARIFTSERILAAGLAGILHLKRIEGMEVDYQILERAYEMIEREAKQDPQRLEMLLKALGSIVHGKEPVHVRAAAIDYLNRLADSIPEVSSWLSEELKLYADCYYTVLQSSSDSVVRVSSANGDCTSPDTSIGALAARLALNDPRVDARPELSIHPHYDHTLVTAHKLLGRTAQALSINRFVLLSGPPASGKSEVGRYLSSQLGWDAEIFNCNRYTSEEDMMQRVGVKANGKTEFTITDGALADALIDGKLFILNEINLARPGSLSFLFKVLADVDTEFDYYDSNLGATVRRKIHPNFRMIATQNPDGPGRKDLNAALKNRAIEIHAPAYSSLELAALLRTKNPGLEKKHPGITNNVVGLYDDIAKRIEARAMGDHAEGYVWNLRHLMRFAEGFAAQHRLTPQDILNAAYNSVGVSLRPEDRKGFFDALRTYVYGDVKISEDDVSAFERLKAQANIGDVEGLVDIPTSARFFHSIISSLSMGYHPWLKGPAGTGKTRLIRAAAGKLGAELFSDTLTPQTDDAKLKGDLKPVTKDGNLGFTHVPAPLVNALRASNKTDRMVICFLDEGAFARPDVLEELNSVLDRDGGIWVLKANGDGMEFLRRGKNFRLAVASNTYGYSGVQLQSEAFRSRMHEIYMDFEYGAGELSRLLGNGGADVAPAPAPSGGVRSDADESSTTPSSQTVIPSTFKQAVSPVAPVRRVVKRARLFEHTQAGFIARSLSPGKKKKDGPAVISAGLEVFHAHVPSHVRDQLSRLSHSFTDDEIETMERRFADLHDRLLGMAAAIGREGDLELRFDPKAESAHMKAELPRVFSVGPDYLLHSTAEQLINTAMHEGGHADISRVGSGYAFTNRLRNALFMVMEDVRTNARVMDRAPGRVEDFAADRKQRYHDLYAHLSQEQRDGLKGLLPHEAFLNGIMSREYGGSSPWDDDPVVGAALSEVWEAVQYAKSLRPDAADPSEVEVQQYVQAFEDAVRTRIEPIYDRLCRDSHQQVEQMLSQMGMDASMDMDMDGDMDRAQDTTDGASSVSGSSKNADSKQLCTSGTDGAADSEKTNDDTAHYASACDKGTAGGETGSGVDDTSTGSNDADTTANGSGTSSDSSKDQSARAKQILNKRADRIIDMHRPVSDLGDAFKNALDVYGDDQDGAQDVNAGNEGKDSPKSAFKPGSLADALHNRRKDYLRRQKGLATKAFSRYLSRLGNLPNRVFQTFDQLLKPNTDFEFEGYFTSGPRINVERAVRAIHGMLTNLNVFMRKTEATGKDYRFSLLLDASSSMLDPIREQGGMGLMALFTDVFERLELPYCIDAFHNSYIPIKGFEDRLLTVDNRNALFNHVLLNYWGKGATNIRGGLHGQLERIREARKTDPRQIEFLFVLTDGEETHEDGSTIRQICDKAAKEGIIIVGIGIGEGMHTVRDEFPIHLVETNPENLPNLLAEFIKEFVKFTEEID